MGCAMSRLCSAGVSLPENAEAHPFANLDGWGFHNGRVPRPGGGGMGAGFDPFERERQQNSNGDTHGQPRGTDAVPQVDGASDGNTIAAVDTNRLGETDTVSQVPGQDDNNITAVDARDNAAADVILPVPGRDDNNAPIDVTLLVPSQGDNNVAVSGTQSSIDTQRAELMDRAARESLPPSEYATFMGQTNGTGIPTPSAAQKAYFGTMNDIYGEGGPGKIVATEIIPQPDLSNMHVTSTNPTIPDTGVDDPLAKALVNEAGRAPSKMRKAVAAASVVAISQPYPSIPSSIKKIKKEIKALQWQLERLPYVTEPAVTLEQIDPDGSTSIRDRYIKQLVQLRSQVQRERAEQNVADSVQATAQNVLGDIVAAQNRKENVAPSITSQAAHEEPATTIEDLKRDPLLWYRLHVLVYDARHEPVTEESHMRIQENAAYVSSDEAEKIYRLPVPVYIPGIGPGINTKSNNLTSISEEGTEMTTLGRVINSRRYEADAHAKREGLSAENGWKATFYKAVAPFMEYAIGIRDRGYQLENRVWFLKLMLNNGLDVTVEGLKDWDMQMDGIDGETGKTVPFKKASYWRHASVQAMRPLSEWHQVAGH